MRSRRFTKSYLQEVYIKNQLELVSDLDRKISIKILSALMQKLGFRLYEIEFLTKQANLFLFGIDQILPGRILLFQVRCSKLCSQV